MSVQRLGAWTLRLGPEATTVGRGEDAVYTFDLEGRPISWWDGERICKRSLASEIHVRRGGAEGRERGVLDPASAAEALESVVRAASALPREGLDATSRSRLDAIARWTLPALLGERQRFDEAYLPISILPPDQYLSVVLQATFGCSWNRCTFCSFYQGRPFRARTEQEFERHLEAVRRLLGRGAGLRRTAFLADGNALLLSNARLEPLLRLAREAFPGRAIHGFVDVVTGERKSPSDWAALRALGLERVHVGLETGHAPLLAWMNKPGTPDETAAFVADLKGAGLSVGVIVMCGAGGERYAEAHVTDTLSLLSRLPLAAGDLVYLSPFVEHRDSEYARRASADGVRPVSESARAAQLARLREGSRAALPRAKTALYDIREFLY